MIEHRAIKTVSRTVADRPNKLIVEPRGPVLMGDFQLLKGQAHRVRKPRG
jgi:hypothetical protein